MKFLVPLKVMTQENRVPVLLEAIHGTTLRKVLLQNKLSPYRGEKKVFNCRGMGICGTCKVLIKENDQWFERRSCQIQCFHPMEIQLK